MRQWSMSFAATHEMLVVKEVRECTSWRDAFDLNDQEHIALVGAGGKTTTLWSLARELCADRLTVATSTTKLGAPRDDAAMVWWQAGMPDAELREALEKANSSARSSASARPVALANRTNPDRIQAVDSGVLDFVFIGCGANVINEADGARMKPFKAPAAHEPAAAGSTSLAIVVIGADALGAAIDAEHLHRSELVAQIAGGRLGAALTADHVAAVVRFYIQRLARQAPTARFALLVNKVDAGPDDSFQDLLTALQSVRLAAVVAATQRERIRRWRAR